MVAAQPRPHLRRRMSNSWIQISRRVLQATVFIFILVASIRHNLLDESAGTASIDALCPFGGLETVWRIVTSGEYVPKTHPSNMILGGALLLSALISGAVFCGWICPFGTLQDALTWLRTKLRLPELHIPRSLDRWLRYFRFVTLAVVLTMTVSTVKLWFADYDPYRTIFGLGWIFEPSMEQWIAYAIAGTLLTLSFFVPRFWCKYTCPLGGALSLVGHLSLLRIRRSEDNCRSCALCEVPCPVGIEVAKAKSAVSTDCIGCLACVESCPRHSTLEVKLAPVWFDGIRSTIGQLRRRMSAQGGA